MKSFQVFLILPLFMLSAFSCAWAQTIKINDDLELIKISEHAYVHVSYSISEQYGRISSNGMFLLNNHECVVFDTPMSDSLTRILITYITDKLGCRITGFIANHWHNDCMGGLHAVHEFGIPSYASAMTVEIAKNKGLPVPENAFRDSLILNLSGKDITCWYPGPAHTMDNIVAWIPSEKTLFGGCMLKGLHAQNLGFTGDGDLDAYPLTLEKVLQKYQQAKVVVPGHGAIGGIYIIEHTLELAKQ